MSCQLTEIEIEDPSSQSNEGGEGDHLPRSLLTGGGCGGLCLILRVFNGLNAILVDFCSLQAHVERN